MASDEPKQTESGRNVGAGSTDLDMQYLTDLFQKQDAPTPFIQWSPDPRSAEHPLVEKFFGFCDRMSGGATAIPIEALRLSEFGNMKDWLMLVSWVPDAAAYRYDHYGRGIARVYGRDMTGRLSTDFPSYISRFFTMVYDAMKARKQRMMTVHQPPNQVFVSTWRRLIVPVAGPDGDVSQFLALNLPENELRAGLEILPVPVLIVSADRVVCYANKQARQAFDAGAFGPWDRTIFDYAALDLETRQSPGEILEKGIVQTSLCRHVRHAQMGAYEATISAALHHDVAFYVILLQPKP